MDFSRLGGNPSTPTLLLKTVGRKSGDSHITPLIYGPFDEEFAIIASRGGAPTHPSWYLNMSDSAEVRFQVAAEIYLGTWREAQGEERLRIWEAMCAINPLFRGYESQRARIIPVVLLSPCEKIASL